MKRQSKEPRQTPCETAETTPIERSVYDSGTLSRGSANSYPMRASRERIELTPQYNQAIQDARMTIEYFVETKFIPEHVRYKSRAGQTHFQAMLKHVLRPETVNRIFMTVTKSKTRLTSVSDWPYLDDVRLCDLNADHVRRILSFASNRDYSWQTIKHIKNVIGAIITHAQQEGCFFSQSPVSHVKLTPKFRKPEENLTVWQTKKILELLRSPEREIALITIYTGMSVIEICNLRWKHVNMSDSPRRDNGELIPPESIAVGAQLNEIGVCEFARGRRRDVAIAGPVLSLLRSLRAGNKHSHPNDFLFTTSAGKAVSPIKVRVSLRPVAKTINIPWLCWQSLRRVRIAARSESLESLGALLDPRSTIERSREMSSIEARAETQHLFKNIMEGREGGLHHAFCAGTRFR